MIAALTVIVYWRIETLDMSIIIRVQATVSIMLIVERRKESCELIIRSCKQSSVYSYLQVLFEK